MTSVNRRVLSGCGTFAMAALVFVACSSSSGGGANASQPAAVTCASPGGPAPGPQDAHCTAGGMDTKQPTDLASCHPDVAAPADDGGSAGDDGGGPGDGGPTGDCEPSSFGPSMYGYQGSDDDCKYDVKWSSTPVCEGGNGVYFTVSATKRVDNSPLTGANPYIESVQACVHPSPNPPAPAMTMTEETTPGTYKIGPIVFDKPGVWIVRFHFYGSCDDGLPTSPHGHAAFFVNVP